MIVFILAAGFGTRLKPITNHIPKALVPVCGISLLKRNLSFFHSQGIKNFAVNMHYLPDQIENFKMNSKIPFTLFHEKDNIRGTGGALYFARKYLCTDEVFCVANCDILSNIDLSELTKKFIESKSICALVAAPAQNKGTIVISKDSKEYCGTIAENIESPDVIPGDFIGVAFYKKEFLNYIRDDDFSILPVWKRVQNNNLSVTVLLEDTILWRDTGTLSELAKIHFDVLDKTFQLPIPKNLYIDYEKKIAYPKGSFLSKLKNIGNYSWIESDNISSNAVIKNSIVLQNSEIKHDISLENTIVTQWGEIPIE